jgi:hypothetical protein
MNVLFEFSALWVPRDLGTVIQHVKYDENQALSHFPSVKVASPFSAFLSQIL